MEYLNKILLELKQKEKKMFKYILSFMGSEKFACSKGISYNTRSESKLKIYD